MSGVLHLEVTESADILEQLLKHQRNAIKRSKVQVLPQKVCSLTQWDWILHALFVARI